MGSPSLARPSADAFAARLKALGYVLDRDISLEARFAARDTDKLRTFAQELVDLQPALIVAAGNPPAAELKSLTTTIPILLFASPSPAESGLVRSLSHPGGNITGTTYNQPEIAGKMVEVLKEAAPRVSRVAVIWNPDVTGNQAYKLLADKAAEKLGVTLQYVDVRRSEDFRLDVLERSKVDALYVTLDATVSAITNQVIQFALERKLPSIGVIKTFVDSGGLLALGPDMDELEAALASYADRILRGASPADLPVLQPSKNVLTVNAKTAKAIGLTLPREVLIRANEVIQ